MTIPLSQKVGDISLVERPGQAVQSLLTGDVDAAWRSMLSPDDLSMGERNALLREMRVPEDSFQGRLVSAVTNPGVILSVLLTFRMPVPSARAMAKAKNHIDGMMARVPILRSLASPRKAFAGTRVPALMDDMLDHQRTIYESYMERIMGPAYERFEQSVGRTMTAREQAMLSVHVQKLHRKALPGWEEAGVGTLFKDVERHMSPELKEVGNAWIRARKEVFNNVWGRPENQKALKSAVERMQKMGFPDEDLQSLATLIENGVERGGPRGIVDYFPHRVVRTQADLQRLRDAAVATLDNKEFVRRNLYRTNTILGREFYRRKRAMVPALQEMAVIGDLVDQRSYMRLQNAMKDKFLRGLADQQLSPRTIKKFERMSLDDILSRGRKTLNAEESRRFALAAADHMPAQYSLKFTPVIESYFHSVGKTYAWSLQGVGEGVLEEVARAKALAPTSARAAWRAHTMENTVIPSMLGRPTPRQAINAQLWDQRIGSMVAQLERPTVQRLLGTRLTSSIREGLQDTHGAFSLRRLSYGAAGYFYLTTLGLSPAAAFKNNFQAILTTGPAVGFGNMVRGQADAWSRLNKYFGYRFGRRALSHAEALKKTYPEFAKAGLASSPLTEEAMNRAMQSAYSLHRNAPRTVGWKEKAKAAMMSMFSASETSVRLGAFHAGLRHAKQSGMKGVEAMKHAKDIVVRTQFVPRLTDTPMVMSPAGALSNPLLRQLSQFPTKMLEFTVDGVNRAVKGDYSQISRQLAGAYIAKEAGDVIGVDLGNALLGGALPTFTNVEESGNVLAPLPVVPPAVAMTGAVASAFSSGDWDIVHRQLPLVVPGGVAGAKAVGFLPGLGGAPQRAARWMDRKYADYENPTASGRIPVYSGKGTLLGFYRPWEIVRSGMGLRGGKIDQEADIAYQLMKESEQIREVRRQWYEARFANDFRRAARIEGEYQRRFGHKLSIDEDQLRRMQERRRMTRIERQLSTLPVSGRAQYEEAVFGRPDSRSFQSGEYRRQKTDYTNQMGLLDEVDPYAIGRRRDVPDAFP